MVLHRIRSLSYGEIFGPVQRAAAILSAILLSILMVLTPGVAAAADNPVKIVVLGDSLSAGYGLEVQDAFPSKLQAALKDHFGKPVEVMVRTAAELKAVAAANPFAEDPGNRVVAMFFDDHQSDEAIESARNVADERLALGKREIYVHFRSGQGRSKLKLGGKAPGTARNMNTVAKLAELAREME